jgi:uracil-DNA glycosylase family 4
MPTKSELLVLLDQKVKQCTKCGLSQIRTNTVFGEGSPNAKLVFIGEAPGIDEDESGRPFIGRSGQVLRKFASEMNWPEDKIYILNSIKCHPPHNREPLIKEMDNCKPFFELQLSIINPKYIICWGRIAAYALLRPNMSMDKFRMNAIRQKFFDYGNAKVLCTYHPSYVLRAGELARMKVIDDLNFFVEQTGFKIE